MYLKKKDGIRLTFTVQNEHITLIPSSKIQKLPDYLINQIKAGEVIERPSNLLKEILENSIDAKASCIDIHIINNGIDLIQCQDNGVGIHYSDLPIAFSKHTTSKIKRFEDLYDLSSFGFRGEALASIASISRLKCISKPSNEKESSQIQIEGGQVISHINSPSNKCGTNLIIKDLFYNTPARLKFIRTQTSEKNALKKIIHCFLLSNLNIQFSIRWDDKEKEYFPATKHLKDRIHKIFFNKKEKNKRLVSFKANYDGYYVNGYFSDLSNKGHSGKSQFLFINKRYFQDNPIHQNIIKVLSTFWKPLEKGYYICFIESPKKDIDVNIHPNKTHIKFSKPHLIHSLIHESIKRECLHKLPTFKKKVEQKEAPPFLSTFPLTNLNHQTDLQVSTPNNLNFCILSPRFYLFFEQNKWFINDFGILTSEYLKQTLMPNISDDEIIPLLVSEPLTFNKGWDPILQNMKSYGFDFERLNPQTILLKSIPKTISLFDPASFIQSLFDEQNAIPKNLSDFLKCRFNRIFLLNQSHINKNIHTLFMQIIPNTKKSLYQRELSTKKLFSLFKDF